MGHGSPQDKSAALRGPLDTLGLSEGAKAEVAPSVLHRHLACSDFHPRGSSFGQDNVHYLQPGTAAHSPSVRVGQSSPNVSYSGFSGALGFGSSFSLMGPTSVHLHLAFSDFHPAASLLSHDQVHLLHPSTKEQSYSLVVWQSTPHCKFAGNKGLFGL